MTLLLPLSLLAAYATEPVEAGVASRLAPQSTYAQWSHGPSSDPSYFPIAVWLQDPRNALAYKRAGINLYVGLWQGPTESQLAALKKAGMPVICHQNRVGLAHRDDPTIVGWMHGDEPDNAQEVRDPNTGRRGYGAADSTVADHRRLRAPPVRRRNAAGDAQPRPRRCER